MNIYVILAYGERTRYTAHYLCIILQYKIIGQNFYPKNKAFFDLDILVGLYHLKHGPRLSTQLSSLNIHVNISAWNQVYIHSVVATLVEYPPLNSGTSRLWFLTQLSHLMA